MARVIKTKKMTEVEKIEEIIFKYGGRQISKKDLKEIRNRVQKSTKKVKASR